MVLYVKYNLRIVGGLKLKKLFNKFFSPYRKIEQEQLKISFGIFKAIFILLACNIIEAIFTSIPYFIASDNFLNNNMIVLLPYEIILFFLLPYIWNDISGKNTKVINTYKKFNLKSIIYPFLLVISFRLIYDSLIYPLVMLVPESEFLNEFTSMANNNFLYFFISATLYAPFTEELLFRGIILNGLLGKYSAKISIPISALIFACAHFNFHQGVNAFILGLALGYIFYKTKSLYLTIFCHFINNLIALVTIAPSTPEISYVVTFLSASIGLGLLVLVIMKYKPNYNGNFEKL